MIELATEWKEADAEFLTPDIDEHARWTEEIEETEEIDETDDVRVGGEETAKALEELRLVESRTSNVLLFEFCRRLVAIQRKYDIRYSPSALHTIFQRWHALNEKHLRTEHDYFTEFLVKLRLVRSPHGAKLSDALHEARKHPPSHRALVLPNPNAHLVASLCRELQHRAGNAPFYLIGRACAALIDEPHSTVANWLKAFQTLGIIKVVVQGRPSRHTCPPPNRAQPIRQLFR